MIATDWKIIRERDCTASAEKLALILEGYINECFPLKKHKIRSSDPPWITPETKRLKRRKIRTYRREGRSENYYMLRNQLEELIATNKKKYIEKVKQKAKENGNCNGYFQAAKSLQSKEAPVRWAISIMYPNMSEAELGEIVAAYFNRISDEYVPL